MPLFVVQEHHSSHLHWDFRIEANGVLKSWAVPKGPSLDPAEKRLAIQVPDHDLEHADYEGIIPEGGYGAGPVLIWDRGYYECLNCSEAGEGLNRGNLAIELHGKWLKGEFDLVKMRGSGQENNWLLIKKRDSYSKPGWETPKLLTPARLKSLRVKAPSCGAS